MNAFSHPAQAARPGGSLDTAYYRWNDSLRRYSSAYTPEALHELAQEIKAFEGDVWVIFDNTAAGEAVRNGLELMECAHLSWSD